MWIAILQFWMSQPSSLVTLNGKDLRRSSPMSVSHGLLKGFCTEPVLLFDNFFFSPHFIITLRAQIRAVVSAPGPGSQHLLPCSVSQPLSIFWISPQVTGSLCIIYLTYLACFSGQMFVKRVHFR